MFHLLKTIYTVIHGTDTVLTLTLTVTLYTIGILADGKVCFHH